MITEEIGVAEFHAKVRKNHFIKNFLRVNINKELVSNTIEKLLHAIDNWYCYFVLPEILAESSASSLLDTTRKSMNQKFYSKYKIENVTSAESDLQLLKSRFKTCFDKFGNKASVIRFD
jgi:site-specific recombinase XerD